MLYKCINVFKTGYNHTIKMGISVYVINKYVLSPPPSQQHQLDASQVIIHHIVHVVRRGRGRFRGEIYPYTHSNLVK